MCRFWARNDTCGEAEYQSIVELLTGTAALLLQLEVSIELSLQAASRAFSQAVSVILDPGPVRAVPPEFYGYVSVITPNETEAEALVGYPIANVEDAQRAGRELVDRGVGAAVIKLGAQGAYWDDGERRGHVPAFPVDAVDTVAAGDAFNGAMAVALARVWRWRKRCAGVAPPGLWR